MDDLQKKLKELKERFGQISQSFDRAALRTEISQLESQTSQPRFWDDQRQASKISQDLADKQ